MLIILKVSKEQCITKFMFVIVFFIFYFLLWIWKSGLHVFFIAHQCLFVCVDMFSSSPTSVCLC